MRAYASPRIASVAGRFLRVAPRIATARHVHRARAMIRVVVLIGDREYPGRSPGYVAPHGVTCPECGADLLIRVVCRDRERDARCEECDAIVGRIIPRVRRSRYGLVSA